ncbi:MAG: hypothetical protein J5965_24810 [Aeriscardovia sp.]|nr:hypothetical protein [Aeriscardovia sp.]
MKHAIMIMAHKNFEFLHHLIEYFTRDCYVFVHIDKKSGITREQEACLRAMPQVSGVYRKYSVHWGGFSILKCELFLLKQALHSTDADYFHLISGQDYPIKPLSNFLEFFEKNKGKEFIRYANIPHPRWDHYTFSRFQYYYPYDYFGKTTAESKRIVNKIVDWQKRHGIKRRIPDHFEHLYGSTQWFSITRKAVETLLDYTHKHPAFYRRARWTFAAEEYYVATVLVNLLPKEDFERRDLRCIRWIRENGNYPANLGTEHFHVLAEQETNFFARKFEEPMSIRLVPLIDKYLLEDRDCFVNSTGGWNYDGLQRYHYDATFAALLAGLCKLLKISSLVDMGCGAGFYVAALRRQKIPAMGYDANLFTEKLSALLLPKGDELCGVADITEDVEVDEPYDMAIAMSLLSCIPDDMREQAIKNLCSISGRYIVLSEEDCNEERQVLRIKEYMDTFKQNGFKENNMGTEMLNPRMEVGRMKRYSVLLERL